MDFQPLFRPESVAVIGVSLKKDRHPANVIYNKTLLRYPVEVFAVNPQGGYYQGETVYKSVSDIPCKIDLAVIAAPAEAVPEILSQCVKSKVGGAALISGGFAESGRQDLQDQIVSIARKSNFPFIGPNCLGIYAPDHIDTFFLPSERMVRPEPGNVAIVSQSGGVLVDQMVKFANEGVGLSLGVSIGNKALIRERELLDFLINDPATEVIAFYVEGFEKNEGRDFVMAAGACAKPIIVLKAGKSTAGSQAVSSHTASIAGQYSVFSAVLSQFGIVEAKNEFEMLTFCEALSRYKTPIEGSVGIITGSGGHGVLAVDVCSSLGMNIPTLSKKRQLSFRKRLSSSVRSIAALGNPIDLTGSAIDDDFVTAADVLSKIPEIDCVILLLLPYSPGISSDVGARLGQIYRKADKPLVVYVPHLEKYRMLIEGFEFNRIPVSPSIEGAVLMAEALRRYRLC